MKNNIGKVVATLDLIVRTVKEHFGIDTETLFTSKNQEIVYARNLCMYLCRIFTSESLEQIGKAIGNRHYTSVIYGYDKIRDMMESEERVRNDVDCLLIEIVNKVRKEHKTIEWVYIGRKWKKPEGPIE